MPRPPLPPHQLQPLYLLTSPTSAHGHLSHPLRTSRAPSPHLPLPLEPRCRHVDFPHYFCDHRATWRADTCLQSLALESVSTCLRLGLGPLGRAPVTQRGLVPGIRECAPPRGVRRCERLRRIVTVIATSTVITALGRPWLARQVADEVRAEGWLRQHPPFISRARERRRSVLLVRASERCARGPSTRKVTHQLWARS